MKLRYLIDMPLGMVQDWYAQGYIPPESYWLYWYAWKWSTGMATDTTQDEFYREHGKEAFWARVDRTNRRIRALRLGRG